MQLVPACSEPTEPGPHADEGAYPNLSPCKSSLQCSSEGQCLGPLSGALAEVLSPSRSTELSTVRTGHTQLPSASIGTAVMQLRSWGLEG